MPATSGPLSVRLAGSEVSEIRCVPEVCLQGILPRRYRAHSIVDVVGLRNLFGYFAFLFVPWARRGRRAGCTIALLLSGHWDWDGGTKATVMAMAMAMAMANDCFEWSVRMRKRGREDSIKMGVDGAVFGYFRQHSQHTNKQHWKIRRNSQTTLSSKISISAIITTTTKQSHNSNHFTSLHSISHQSSNQLPHATQP